MSSSNNDSITPEKILTSSDVGLDIEALSPRQLRVVLVCDVVESVRWMEQDEDNAITRWSQFAAAVRSRIAPEHAGSVVKSTGDGLMLEFESAPQAVAAANAMQKLSSEGNAGFDAERQMHLRIGIHQAQVRRDAHDLYGHGVNLAARISTLAGPGEIIVSAPIRDDALEKLHVDFDDLGLCYLKHVEQPVRAFRYGAAQAQGSIQALSQYATPLLPVVAVIPLWPIQGKHEAHIAIGNAIADDVISSISKTRSLHVVSRLSTSKFSRATVDIDLVCKLLGANYIVSGSYSAAADGKVVVRVQLCFTKDQRVLWSDTIKADVSDIFQGQDSVVPEIASNIGQLVVNHELSRSRLLPLSTLESYSLYLGSLSMLHRSSYSDFSQAQGMLEHLRHRHPQKSAPHATLAKWYLTRILQGWSTQPDRDRLIANQLSERALQCDPYDAFSKATNGFLSAHFDSDLSTGIATCQDSLEIDPQDAQIWRMLATIHCYLGDGISAKNCADTALKLTPVDPAAYLYQLIRGAAALAGSEYTDALEYANNSLRNNITHVPTHRLKVIALSLMGESEQATQAAKTLLRHAPHFTVNRFMANYPGRHQAHATSYQEALLEAGLPK